MKNLMNKKYMDMTIGDSVKFSLAVGLITTAIYGIGYVGGTLIGKHINKKRNEQFDEIRIDSDVE